MPSILDCLLRDCFNRVKNPLGHIFAFHSREGLVGILIREELCVELGVVGFVRLVKTINDQLDKPGTVHPGGINLISTPSLWITPATVPSTCTLNESRKWMGMIPTGVFAAYGARMVSTINPLKHHLLVEPHLLLNSVNVPLGMLG